MIMNYLINENGEVLQVIKEDARYVELELGDRVLRKNAVEYLGSTMEIKYDFVKLNHNAFVHYCKKYSILPLLICYVGYSDNICEYKNGKKINLNQLIKLCNISKSTLNRQVEGMIQDDLIHKIKNGNSYNIMINPYLCIRGKRLDLTTYNEFKSSTLKNVCGNLKEKEKRGIDNGKNRYKGQFV